MDLLTILAVLVFVVFIVSFVLILISDGDLSLMFLDKFGNKLSTLKDQVVWITGASTGIGAACAVEAASHGAKVVISARSENQLEDVKKKCLAAGKSKGLTEKDVLVLPMDMTDFSKHKECLDKVLQRFEKIDIMVHNAGRSQRARWEHTDLQVDKDLFDLNVFSVVSLSRLILPHFEARGRGCFALMSSTAGKVGVPFSGTYTASKHALHGYFESLRTEKMGSGISVTFLCPGPTFSNLLQVAATEKAGERFGESMKATDKRMTSERCAHLTFVAIANKLEEAWICFFPVLPLMYFNQYMPTIGKRILSFLGPKLIMNIRDSRNTIKED